MDDGVKFEFGKYEEVDLAAVHEHPYRYASYREDGEDPMEKSGQDSGPDYPFLLLPCRCCASLEKVTSSLMKQVLMSLLFYRWGDRSRHKEANNVMRSKKQWEEL